MFMVYLRRNLAEMLGVSRSKLPKVLRVEYAKVAEYQTRGVVHFHAVIRLDGPEGPDAHPPIGVDTDVLREAIIKAARTSRIVAPTAQGEPHRLLRWGTQLDLRPVAMDTDWTPAEETWAEAIRDQRRRRPIRRRGTDAGREDEQATAS
jgi:hypothetical protein